jgi:hypothetical protein
LIQINCRACRSSDCFALWVDAAAFAGFALAFPGTARFLPRKRGIRRCDRGQRRAYA